MAGLPTGTVTFLFTDLEGSTRLWEQHPDAMKGALARHDEILRAAVDAHGGAIVKTTGDGLHAAFSTADHALAAAVDAQRALVAEAWPLPEPFRVRMGVHTGAAEERDGDYYGPAVNRAARVSAAAHGGQILVSHAAEELTRDTLPPDTTLVDLGEHRLRDLARAERVFQLTAPGLETTFPPPRSIDAYPGNLPIQLSSFIGRDTEIRAIGDALRDTRLLTLTGVGGVGKTRLAIQVAAELLPHYPDGAWLCELAPATDTDALDQILVAALGITARTGRTLQESVLEALAAKELLVVLDNCEHLIAEAGRLAEAILRECPKVRILATSREGLGVEGEHLRVVRSLPVPDATAAPDDLAAAESTRLFLERAHAARGDLVVDEPALRAIADICRRLDGIPLAIELAAARTAAMAPAEIARRLDERFRLLTGGRRTAVERHHTLRATVDWSYSLLADRERTVFDRLGAFSGSFDTTAAEAIATDEHLEAWDVLDALTELVAKSMVVSEPRSDTTRYTLLETMRHYARERLDDDDEADTIRRRHATHYTTVAQALEVRLRGPDELAARAALVDDLDNLRAGVGWGLERDDASDQRLALLTIAFLALEAVLDRTMGVGEWAARALALVDDVEPWIRCAVLAAAGEERRGAGDFDAALVLAEAALRDGVALDGSGAALALLTWASIIGMRGRPDLAVERLVAAKATMVDEGARPYDISAVAAVAATWAGFAQQGELAESLAEEALRLTRAIGTPAGIAAALWSLGNAIETTRPEEALRCYEESIALTQNGASGSSYPAALAFAAVLWHRSGEPSMALRRAIECIDYVWSVGDPSQMTNGLYAGVVVLIDLGRPEPAATFLGIIDRINGAQLTSLGETDPRWDIAGVRERLLATLGPEAFRRAGERGGAIPHDAFAAYAVDELQKARRALDVDGTMPSSG